MTKINAANLIERFSHTKMGQFFGNPAANAAVAIATVSNVTKDGVNCAYYVTQSLHNERIPEDQRKFVAGLDLANGLLNVCLQLGVTAAFTKTIANAFDKFIEPKFFTEAKYKEIYTDWSTRFKPGDLLKKVNAEKTFAKTGFCLLGALVSMQVITKRIIVPLIATPLASVFKKGFEKQETDKTEENKKLQIANA